MGNKSGYYNKIYDTFGCGYPFHYYQITKEIEVLRKFYFSIIVSSNQPKNYTFQSYSYHRHIQILPTMCMEKSVELLHFRTFANNPLYLKS